MHFKLMPMTLVAAALAMAPLAAHGAPALPKGIDTDCIETILLNCSVTAAGFASLHGDAAIAYQIQDGFSAESGIGAGVVLFEDKDGEWSLLAAEFDGVQYNAPHLVDSDQMVLHVAGFTQGTGSFNADLLFVRDYDGGAWQQVDIFSWFDEIGPMLPDGLEIWKGVDFDFGDWFWSSYNARTPLWNQSDANCCPTGGWAEIAFEIEDGRLVPTRVHYRPFEEDEAD